MNNALRGSSVEEDRFPQCDLTMEQTSQELKEILEKLAMAQGVQRLSSRERVVRLVRGVRNTVL